MEKVLFLFRVIVVEQSSHRVISRTNAHWLRFVNLRTSHVSHWSLYTFRRFLWHGLRLVVLKSRIGISTNPVKSRRIGHVIVHLQERSLGSDICLCLVSQPCIVSAANVFCRSVLIYGLVHDLYAPCILRHMLRSGRHGCRRLLDGSFIKSGIH